MAVHTIALSRARGTRAQAGMTYGPLASGFVFAARRVSRKVMMPDWPLMLPDSVADAGDMAERHTEHRVTGLLQSGAIVRLLGAQAFHADAVVEAVDAARGLLPEIGRAHV